ncbi:MAG: sensor histidine kinase [Lactobacillales bacterium]|nr:sensor histidine kinase [Lactobacillales bacterium]
MSRRRSQIIAMFSSVFITFIILVSLCDFYIGKLRIVFSFLYDKSDVPIFVHFVILLIVSLVIGLLFFTVMKITERFEDKKIEHLLYYLANGEYRKVLNVRDKSDIILADSKIQNIILLAETLQRMNERLIELSQHIDHVEGEDTAEVLRLERLRLSRELHDSVSQQLFAAMMILAGLDEQAKVQNLPKNLKKQLESAISVIHAAQSEMRALLLHLRPVELSGKNLHEGIEHLLQELQTKVQLKLVWNINAVSIDNSSEDHLFRILQELLSNSLRHAKAELVEIYLKQTENMVQLLVVDDGVGFDVNEPKTVSYGLTNIRERVENMGGIFKIVSFKNQGTRIEVKIPYVK